MPKRAGHTLPFPFFLLLYASKSTNSAIVMDISHNIYDESTGNRAQFLVDFH